MKPSALSIIAALVTLSGICTGQEGLRPLGSNPAYIYAAPDSRMPLAMARITSSASLQLPFRDDFSYAPLTPYPDQARWSDSAVYVNTGYAIAPPSIGVGTFDGLNRHGYPYWPQQPNLSLSYAADTLTTRDINLKLVTANSKTLQPSDSVALVFFYQARGYGDPPEPSDSLIVDLYKPLADSGRGVWVRRVWSSPGSNSQTIDTTFKKAFIRIQDTAYFHDGFRFRFRNRATIAGNYDQWHIDYVYLNMNLFKSNTTSFDDITITTVPTPFLREYSAMPFEQYTAGEMASRCSVRIRNNNGSGVVNVSYQYRVFDLQTNNQIYLHDGGPTNLLPFAPNGYDNAPAHRNPTVAVTFSPMNDSADYLVKHYLFRSGQSAGSNDFIPANDTVYYYQRFRNFYAFDDGSAEAGYYVNGKGGSMAVKIRVNVTDSLRGARIYFDPSTNVISGETNEFRLCVWSDAGAGPGGLILQDSIRTVKYFKTGFKGVPEYHLTRPIVLQPGSYYIGLSQRVATGIVVGFDRNYDSHQQLYYNDGSGWWQSTVRGSLMFRPLFGQYVPPPAAVTEYSKPTSFSIYPNPATTHFIIQHAVPARTTYALYNLLGRLEASGEYNDSEQLIESGSLEEGVYVLVISRAGEPPQQRRILITR